MIKKIDHIAIVVKDIDKAIKGYEEMFGFKKISKMEFGGGEAIVAIIKVGDINLELFQPVKAGTAFDKFLKENGGGLHHISFLTDDILKEIKNIKAKGKKMTHNEPIELPDAKIAFVDAASAENVSIELAERK
jgi:methylmalonyl-CoA/ethylmalonyl-CoA epimerase